MTALRTVGGDAAAAERAKVKAELVADAVAQLKQHIEADAPTQQALFGRLMSKALDDFADRTKAIRKGEFWRGALWGALLSAGLTLVAVAYVYERAGMWGATLERFEGANAELRQTEDAR